MAWNQKGGAGSGSGFSLFHTLIPMSVSFTVHQEKVLQSHRHRHLSISWHKGSTHSGLLTLSLLRLGVSRSFRYQSTPAKLPRFFDMTVEALDWYSIDFICARPVEKVLRSVLLARGNHIISPGSKFDVIPRTLILAFELETK
jgi:hypothetical protein